MNKTHYPAKLLLFGEHTVNAGSRALAMPLHLFSGHWTYQPQLPPNELVARQMQLPQLADYLQQLQHRGELLAELDVAAFKAALANGLVFESNIPTGYGAGSSGALVAAIYDNWKLEDDSGDLISLKNALAQIEAFFHGTSSGTDPLICYLQKPVLLNNSEIRPLPLTRNPQSTHHQFFLLNTGMSRKATPFIAYFLEKMQEKTFSEKCQTELVPAVNAAIESFLEGNSGDVFSAVHQIGAFQLNYLEKMIPEQFRPIWRRGLEGSQYKLKVCGAGGGGFILGIARDFEATKLALKEYSLLLFD